jgi:hypothetical protein
MEDLFNKQGINYRGDFEILIQSGGCLEIY